MIVSRHRPQASRPPPSADELGFTLWRPRGPLAQVAGLALILTMTVYGTWALIHAATTHEIPVRHGWATQAGDPVGFRLHVVLYGACLLPVYGFVLLALYGLATRRRSQRKVDAYLQRRTDEGSRTSAIPPRLL